MTGLEAVTGEALVVVSMLELELVSVEDRVKAATTGVALGTPTLVLWPVEDTRGVSLVSGISGLTEAEPESEVAVTEVEAATDGVISSELVTLIPFISLLTPW